MQAGSQLEKDQALMKRVAAGDARAFRELSETHLDSIVRFAYRITGRHAEAEDIAQDTFLRAWQRAQDYEPKARLSTWLHTIAKNLAIDRLRKERRRGAHVEVDAERDMAPASGRPSQLLLQKSRSLAVEQALAALPERQRVALVLSHEQGLSNPEIASVLQCSVEAVESLLSRARSALRKLLQSTPPEQQPTTS
jgi:RNA polymerase sigma-70 factor (ECF subfamily)